MAQAFDIVTVNDVPVVDKGKRVGVNRTVLFQNGTEVQFRYADPAPEPPVQGTDGSWLLGNPDHQPTGKQTKDDAQARIWQAEQAAQARIWQAEQAAAQRADTAANKPPTGTATNPTGTAPKPGDTEDRTYSNGRTVTRVLDANGRWHTVDAGSADPTGRAAAAPSAPSFSHVTLPSGAVVAFDNHTGQPYATGIGPDPTTEDVRQAQAQHARQQTSSGAAGTLSSYATLEDKGNADYYARERQRQVDDPLAIAQEGRLARTGRASEINSQVTAEQNRQTLANRSGNDLVDQMLKTMPYRVGVGFGKMLDTMTQSGDAANFQPGLLSYQMPDIAATRQAEESRLLGQVPTYAQTAVGVPNYPTYSMEDYQRFLATLGNPRPALNQALGY